ncbi:hypothetical protein I2I05_12975 [Hymenobacter sp. BT683]|uniref:PH domain-containing protein n=1 Tax=Hymenobacter jeongseonensis TaxID=2791027 RepID=A0ABS0IIZ5_9BACT|nr:hypothetical protein [Hymenobacter jeongseonensis]MBF9238311.1 hypothetical protein [Hymenobacter jeongseonensis]
MAEFFDFIKYPLIIAITTWAMNYLRKQSKKDVRPDAQGNITLVVPLFIGLLGAVCSAIGLSVLVFGLLNFDGDDIGAQLFFFILFVGLGLPMVLLRYVYQIVLMPDGIAQRSMFGKKQWMAWANIQTVEHSAGMGELRLFDGVKKIKCHVQVVGFDLLVEELSKRLGKTRAEMGISLS